MRTGRARSALAGGAFALAAALAFGGTTPLVQRFGRGVGPFATAALLYAGSAAIGAVPTPSRDEPLRRADALRVVAVTALGAVIAPVALAWGLQHTSGVVASLLLNLEALFTVILARAIWRETVGPRSKAALAAMLAGGVLLVDVGRAESVQAGWGALAVVGATLAWGADSVLSRPLSERNTAHVVLAKGLLGAALSAAIARGLGERWPAPYEAAALLACGTVGYGASLRLYLHAQRAFGAARTGTVFAAAPFVGAAVAWAMGQRAGGAATVAAAALCALGVGLQLGEARSGA